MKDLQENLNQLFTERFEDYKELFPAITTEEIAQIIVDEGFTKDVVNAWFSTHPWITWDMSNRLSISAITDLYNDTIKTL